MAKLKWLSLVYAVDAFALKKLQELEASYPVIKKPSDEVIVVVNYKSS